jgi:hypothetical protein
MTDKQDDGRGELIAALHQVTTFAEGLLNLTEKLQLALESGVPMSDEDGARLRAGIANWRAQMEVFKTRLNSLTISPPSRLQ